MGSTCSPQRLPSTPRQLQLNFQLQLHFHLQLELPLRFPLRFKIRQTQAGNAALQRRLNVFLFVFNMWQGQGSRSDGLPHLCSAGPRSSGALNLSLGFVAQSRKLHNCPRLLKYLNVLIAEKRQFNCPLTTWETDREWERDFAGGGDSGRRRWENSTLT